MPVISLELPSMYGDHHVTAVRQLLFDLNGVEDVYASSSFQFVEVQFDAALVDEEAIRNTLGEAGYLGEIPMPAETDTPGISKNGGEKYFRHSAALENTGQVISFTQDLPRNSRPLWPCPGMGVTKIKEEEATHG